MVNPIVVIPARLSATRLPDKPLADIWGEPMIVHVWRRGMEAGIGPVIVAAGDAAIAEAVEAAGGTAVLTDPDLPSGTDRVAAALAERDPDRKHDIVVNLQGDLPTLEPSAIALTVELLEGGPADMSTLGAVITDPEEVTRPSVVKAVVDLPDGADRGRALYFTRTPAPSGEGPLIHHIGIYGFRREALERFVTLPPSPLERREKLEQLRALSAGMRVDLALIGGVPLGVDTADDLEAARAALRKAPPGP